MEHIGLRHTETHLLYLLSIVWYIVTHVQNLLLLTSLTALGVEGVLEVCYYPIWPVRPLVLCEVDANLWTGMC